MPESTMIASTRERLPMLDALRGIAAVGVVMFHLPGTPLTMRRMYLLVDLFFILSGFVMSLSAEPRLASGLRVSSFLQARLRRVWPLMALGVLLNTAVFLTEDSFANVLPLTVLGLMMVPVLTADVLVYPINGPQWSLVWELAANAAHGLVLRRLSDRALLWLALAGGAGVIWADRRAGCGCAGGDAMNWALGAPRVLWSYTIGMWMARQWRQGTHRAVLPWPVVLAAVPLALMGLPFVPLSTASGDMAMTLAVLPLLFWAACACRTPDRLPRVLTGLGAMSFPLYATHPAVLHLFAAARGHWPMQIAALMSALSLAALIAGRRRIVANIRRWRSAQGQAHMLGFQPQQVDDGAADIGGGVGLLHHQA